MNRGQPFHLGVWRLVIWTLAVVLLVLAFDRLDWSTLTPAARNGDGLFEKRRERLEADRRVKVTDDQVEKEWPQVEQFIAQNSPNRYAHLQKIAEHLRQPMKIRLILRVRDILRMREESKELYDIILAQVKTEDDIFGLLLQYHRPASDKSAILKQLHEKMAERFDSGIAERKLRIQLVKRALDDQEKSIGVDLGHRDQLIDERVKAVVAHGIEAMHGHGGSTHEGSASPGLSEDSAPTPR